MTIVYKLTNQEMQTGVSPPAKLTRWVIGEKQTASGKGNLCGRGWLHAYIHPLLANFLNPIHANFSNPRLFECEGFIGKDDNGLKIGCTELTILKEIPLDKISTNQRVAFCILCAKEVYNNEEWNTWANNWLSGKDRSLTAAGRQVRATAGRQVRAAEAAGAEARAAAGAAAGAGLREALRGEAEVRAAAGAARAADANKINSPLNLIALANIAMTYR
jgi:hypothetical protein